MSDPVILFFILGLAAGLIRSDLKIPGVLYESLSIFLLLAIGLKGGVALSKHAVGDLLGPMVVVVAAATLVPIIGFLIARYIGRYDRANAGALAAHYGSVSVVTFAVASSFLMRQSVPSEGYMSVFLVILEIPGLLIGVALARMGAAQTRWVPLIHEILTGKSIVLLVGGLVIGYMCGEDGAASITPLFFGLFKGLLAIFLLEMGLVTARGVGLRVGGATLLATLFASAAYIAAPAAVRMAVPEANPSLSIGASLGVTFPFNLTIGIPLYFAASQWLLGASV